MWPKRIWPHLLKKSFMENFIFLCSGNFVSWDVLVAILDCWQYTLKIVDDSGFLEIFQK